MKIELPLILFKKVVDESGKCDLGSIIVISMLMKKLFDQRTTGSVEIHIKPFDLENDLNMPMEKIQAIFERLKREKIAQMESLTPTNITIYVNVDALCELLKPIPES